MWTKKQLRPQIPLTVCCAALHLASLLYCVLIEQHHPVMSLAVIDLRCWTVEFPRLGSMLFFFYPGQLIEKTQLILRSYRGDYFHFSEGKVEMALKHIAKCNSSFFKILQMCLVMQSSSTNLESAACASYLSLSHNMPCRRVIGGECEQIQGCCKNKAGITRGGK